MAYIHRYSRVNTLQGVMFDTTLNIRYLRVQACVISTVRTEDVDQYLPDLLIYVLIGRGSRAGPQQWDISNASMVVDCWLCRLL